MIYKNSNLLLKYQKTVAKLVEFNIDKTNYPKINLNYRKLSFPTICYISEACENIINNQKIANEQKEDIQFCCEYYDAALKSRVQLQSPVDFMLEAIVSFIINDDFGSAKALFDKYKKLEFVTDDNRILLYNLLSYIFNNNEFSNNDEIYHKILGFIKNDDLGGFDKFLSDFYKTIYLNNDYIDSFYLECSLAIAKLSIINSSKRLIPQYSKLELEYWYPYFSNKNSIKMLWPAQKLIGTSGFLSGKSGLIQLPTGVGKTKSMELIIESLFLGKRGKCCLIVAPLRALCNQISEDLIKTFNKKIKKMSDILDEDYIQYFDNDEEKIVICTPEKLLFILHHNIELLESIDLMVFDECHMFDDPTRGAMFELLLSMIKEKKNEHHQIILMSAVLSNANDIASWFFDDSNTVAFDENIKTTPKSIGFITSHSQIYYYSENLNEYDFFLPNVYERTKLITKKGCKGKFFPDNTSTDYGLYLSNKLCTNGGVAIYVSRRDSINTTIKRLAEVNKKGIEFLNLSLNSNNDEMKKFVKYFDEIYGKDNIYSKGALLGTLPHHSRLGFGLRNSIEYSFKKHFNSLIVCTSTLAQGVNVPIKYLILSSTKNGQSPMSTRNFQNLIGRTARAGSFTEGSIIISDPNNFDEKDTGNFGTYRWNDVISKFNSKNTEPCISSIIKMFREHTEIMKGYKIFGDRIVDFIENNIDCDWKQKLENSLIDELKKNSKYNSMVEYNLKELVNFYYSTITQLETNICFSLSFMDIETLEIDSYIDDKAKTLFAYYLASKDEKPMLLILLKKIVQKILNGNIDYIKIGHSLSNINDAKLISSIIEENNLDSTFFKEEELLNVIINAINSKYSSGYSYELCRDWIKGLSFSNISNSHGIDAFKIEKICNQSISYSLSFFIGNMIDLLDEENLNKQTLMLLQRELKYGVNDFTSILFCEEIINDRHVAKMISEIIGNVIQTKDELIKAMKNNQELIMSVLQNYPTYFLNQILFILQNN